MKVFFKRNDAVLLQLVKLSAETVMVLFGIVVTVESFDDINTQHTVRIPIRKKNVNFYGVTSRSNLTARSRNRFGLGWISNPG